MLVVYGAKKKIKKIKSLGVSVCENCGHTTEQILAKEVGHLHIYYIPVFPYLSGYKGIICPNCGLSKILDKSEFKELQER